MVPFIPIGIRLLLLLTIFRDDTPAYLDSQGQHDDARRVIEKIYTSDAVEEEL